MSGSRGEANFVFKCKNCKVVHPCYSIGTSSNRSTYSTGVDAIAGLQRDSSATIKEAPKAYLHTSPPQKVNILEFDCRGLEFTEFKAEVNHTPRILVCVRC